MPHFSKQPYTVTVIGDGGAGMQFISGEGAPTQDIGQPGDVYLDTSNGDLYKNENGSWQLQMNLVGPQGEQGPQGPQGPAGEDGADGVSVVGASSDGTNIIFELSDGSTIEVPWPAQ